MHGLTGGDWKRSRNLRKPRQSPTLPIRTVTCGKGMGSRVAGDGVSLMG
jgi:hypothetical protein